MRSTPSGTLFLLFFICASFGFGGQSEKKLLIPERLTSGWSPSGNTRTFIKEDLFNHIDGGAEQFLEFGFRRLLVQKYIREKAEMTLEVYEMEDIAAAMGIYLQKRGRETLVKDVAARNTGDRYQITAWKGHVFVQVNNPSGDAGFLPAMAELINLCSVTVPEEIPATPIDLLPAENRIPGSELLIRGPFALQNLYTLGDGDILSLGGRIYAAAAVYRPPSGSTFTLLLVPYADEATAGAAFRYLAGHLDSYLTMIQSEENRFVFRDFKNRFGQAILKQNIIEIRLNLDSKDQLT